jgi:hypothetical protein
MKPYWSVANILFWLLCWYNLVYITYSRIFGKDVSKEIGLKLFISVQSPFLCRALFQKINWEGKIPDKSDLLQMYVRGEM